MNTFDSAIVIPALSGLVGAAIGGIFTLLAVEKSNRHTLALKKKDYRRQIDGILRAVQYELEILGEVYLKEAGRALNSLKQGHPFLVHFSLTEKYFIVYPNNTSLIAQIDDAELCKSIVVTYNKANFLIELFRINNWYLERRSECEKQAGMTKDKKYIEAGNDLLSLQIQHSMALLAAHQDLGNETASLLKKIKHYQQHGIS